MNSLPAMLGLLRAYKEGRRSMAESGRTWGGVWPSLITPFAEDGAIDIDAQRAETRFCIDAGSHGLVCFGLAGEVHKLTPEERKRLGAAILEEAGGRVPVLLGVGAEAEHTACELAREA